MERLKQTTLDDLVHALAQPRPGGAPAPALRPADFNVASVALSFGFGVGVATFEGALLGPSAFDAPVPDNQLVRGALGPPNASSL